jgi:hypothetical protein
MLIDVYDNVFDSSCCYCEWCSWENCLSWDSQIKQMTMIMFQRVSIIIQNEWYIRKINTLCTYGIQKTRKLCTNLKFWYPRTNISIICFSLINPISLLNINHIWFQKSKKSVLLEKLFLLEHKRIFEIQMISSRRYWF